MLRILRSALGAPYHERIAELILARTAMGQRSYLIVPEQETVLAEAEMSKISPDSAPLYFEVTNFTRLINTTFRALGGLAGEYCDRGKSSLIMWRVLTELSPTLGIMRGRREVSAGLVESMLSAVAELESLGIGAGELSRACEESAVASDARLSEKLSDILKIYALYKRLLSERYVDPSGDASEVIKRLRENPDFLSDTEIFIEDFTSFTEAQYALIGEISRRTAVTVHLPLPKARPDAFEYEEIRNTQKHITDAARRCGAEIKIYSEDGRSTAPEALSELSELLWQTATDRKISPVSDELRVFEASTTFEECDFIAADIRSRVMAGAKYSDFAIIMRSADKYDGLLDTALMRAGIPTFSSERKGVDEYEAIKLLYTALAVCQGGFRRDDVIAYAKCGLSGVSAEACDEFEMYVGLWQINGKRFTDGVMWNMNPLGYSPRRPAGTDEKLLRIAKTREAIIGPLSLLAEKLKGLSTVGEYARALYGFLASIGLEDSLRSRAASLVSFGEGEAAEATLRLWRLICDALDTLVEVSGDTRADTESFLGQLKVLLSSMSVSRIPSSADSVTVGAADMLRLFGKRHVYLIGVLAGEFPAAVGSVSYFTERERELLSGVGVAIEPSLVSDSARELFIFTRAISYARESLTLTYAQTNTRYKRTERGTPIDKIIKLTGGRVKPTKISALPISRRVYTPEAALLSLGESGEDESSIKEALMRAGYERELSVCEAPADNRELHLGESARREAYGGKISLTQSRIDSFVGCPFGYFCKYTLKLSEDKLAELDAPGIGSFIHAILENFFRKLAEDGRGAGDLTAEEREALTMSAAREYVTSLGEDVTEGKGRVKIKLTRLCRAALPVVEGLCEEFATSRFTPRFFELAIRGGDGEGPAPVSMKCKGGDEISVYGIIDRVDTYKRGSDVCVRVIDYKTGAKDFDPSDLAEAKNLQMFLYLRSLAETENPAFRKSIGVGEGGRIIPAGVIYVKTAISDVKVDTPSDEEAVRAVKLAQAREGMVLDDPDVIDAMGPRYTPVGSPDSDEISKRKKHLLYTEDGWGELMRTVEDSVIRVAEDIKGGNIGAVPSESGGRVQCEFCEFKPVCRAAKK